MCYSISIEEKAKAKNVERAFGGCAKQEKVTKNDNHRRNPKSVFRFFREREKNRGLHTAEQSIHQKYEHQGFGSECGYLDVQHHPFL